MFNFLTSKRRLLFDQNLFGCSSDYCVRKEYVTGDKPDAPSPTPPSPTPPVPSGSKAIKRVGNNLGIRLGLCEGDVSLENVDYGVCVRCWETLTHCAYSHLLSATKTAIVKEILFAINDAGNISQFEAAWEGNSTRHLGTIGEAWTCACRHNSTPASHANFLRPSVPPDDENSDSNPPAPAPAPSPSPPPTDLFRLKLYWQEGYYWQEETRERKCKCVFELFVSNTL